MLSFADSESRSATFDFARLEQETQLEGIERAKKGHE
jgi:hypothetical protein